jgi:FkbM family methyltransferase
MVSHAVRAFVRRHPVVRHATRQLRIRLPESWGGLDRERLPPRVREFDLALPRREQARSRAPEVLRIRAPGDYWLPRLLHHRGLGAYEREGLACFLAALEGPTQGAVLDVGANIGIYAALAATHSQRPVYAFEPTPEVARVAEGIAADNGLDHRVVELALSNHSGTGTLRLSAVTEGSNSLVQGPEPEMGRVKVPVDTLARWRDREKTVPAILKIDTEATEPDVVSGALEILRRYRPLVLCEVRPHLGVAERLMALLEPFDYSWHHLAGPPPRPPEHAITPCDEHRMWLFAPREPSDGFWERARSWYEALARCTH